MLMPEDDPNMTYIMVATGTGIAPFRSFLRRLFGEATPAGKNFKGLAWLFLGVANKDALLYDEEFQVYLRQNPDKMRLDYALSREGVVEAHLVGVLAEVHLELLVVEERVLVGDTEEEPGETLEVLASGGGLAEEAAEEGAEGGDTGAGGNHDVGHVGVILGHEHNLARRASELDLVTGLGIAQVVGADTLLGGGVGLELRAPVGGAAHAQGGGLAILEITVAGGRDRVKADAIGLVLLAVDAGGEP